MDIMFLVVLATIFLGFKPLTAAMIVIMSLLDDIPIMTIAYDNTPVSERPIRWNMPKVLGIASVLGLFSVVESFGMLLIGIETLGDAKAQGIFGFSTPAELQTAMFLQLVAGGHLLLLVTRTERWFLRPPFPAAPLFLAIVLTQIVAILMCAFGWLVEPISWKLIAWVWAYNLVWMFLLSVIRLVADAFIENRTARARKSVNVVNQPLRPNAQPIRSRLGG